ncbi:hypothetical protein Dimus_002007 [Dionaea muscipula]
MACSSSRCQAGCYKDEEEEDQNDAVSPKQPQQTEKRKEESNGISPPGHDGDSDRRIICAKCKVSEAFAGGSGGGEDSRFCAECFRNYLFGKFRFAVTSNGMISPTDKVLVAFSGGPSSRVALQFVHEMQYKAQKNFDASRDKSLPVFTVGVAFVDESAACTDSINEISDAIKQITSIVSDLSPPKKDLLIVPIEGLYPSNISDKRDRLKKLLDAVIDDTGKEDLLLRMRILALQKISMENGYSKLVLGSCTSRIACHIISATVKGRGYSLPADIQYVDARWKIPLLLPLRDCLVQELSTLCELDGLKTVGSFKGPPCSGINALVSSFVTLLQEENPSRECTIMRTAGKLTPFDFNKLQEDGDSNAHSASYRRRQRKFNLKADESTTTPESFCSLCNSPLDKSDIPSSFGFSNGSLQQGIGANCCSSCKFQILPHDPSAVEHFYSLLPSSSSPKLLKSLIQDFLLSDSED